MLQETQSPSPISPTPKKKMEHRRTYSLSLLIFFLFCLLLISFSGSVEAYKNYTVGDSLGWYDKLLKPSINYQKWAASKNFSLGDFLIFNTDSNHSVVQTYNFTTYKQCDYDDAEFDDTTEWSAADPNAVSPQPVTVAVPLIKEGMTYFFSGNYDGEQCEQGQQHFNINVSHGHGLPPSLRNPSESPGPASADNNDGDSAPDTVIPSNFNNPHEEKGDDAKEDSGSGSLALFLRNLDGKLNGILVFLGFVWVFA